MLGNRERATAYLDCPAPSHWPTRPMRGPWLLERDHQLPRLLLIVYAELLGADEGRERMIT
jgi:hypothetical protein